MLNKLLPFGLVAAWVLLIFSLSSHDAQTSSQLSGGITQSLIDFIENIQPNFSERVDVDGFHGFIRSVAHFKLYFILGVWSVNALSAFFNDWFRLVVDATLFALVIAVFDEINQRSVPGRVMSMTDVFIDTLGALVGATLLVIVFMKVKKMNIT